MASSAGGLLQACHKEVRLPLLRRSVYFSFHVLVTVKDLLWFSPFFGAFASGRDAAHCGDHGSLKKGATMLCQACNWFGRLCRLPGLLFIPPTIAWQSVEVQPVWALHHRGPRGRLGSSKISAARRTRSGGGSGARTCHRSTRRRRLAHFFQEQLPCCTGEPSCCAGQQLAKQWQLWRRAMEHGSATHMQRSSWGGSFTFGVLCVFLLQGKGTQHVQSARLIIFLSASCTSLQKCISWPFFFVFKAFCKRMM